jgi:hypothetical protein
VVAGVNAVGVNADGTPMSMAQFEAVYYGNSGS